MVDLYGVRMVRMILSRVSRSILCSVAAYGLQLLRPLLLLLTFRAPSVSIGGQVVDVVEDEELACKIIIHYRNLRCC
jgi:hypothetical protein